MDGKAKSRMAFGASAVLFIAIGAIVAAFLLMGSNAKPQASPNADEQEYVEEQGGLFPVIDWEYWKSVNPDIIGWVTVPGTAIDYPIVQAHADDPTYYLRHDIYGNWNIYGCPYLDTGCSEDGFNSPNAVVFGHHMESVSDNSMFADFANYSDKQYAMDHAMILLQTPDTKQVLNPRYVDVIAGWSALKRIDFLDKADYEAWYAESRDDADVVLDADAEPSHVITFCTCSYNYWSYNERTLVIASPEVDVDIWDVEDEDGSEPSSPAGSDAVRNR